MPRKGTWQRFRRATCGGMSCFGFVMCVFCFRVVRFLETCIYMRKKRKTYAEDHNDDDAVMMMMMMMMMCLYLR